MAAPRFVGAHPRKDSSGCQAQCQRPDSFFLGGTKIRSKSEGNCSPRAPFVGQEPCVDSLFEAEPLPGSEGAAGSGCTPGTTSLPDGIWLGIVTAKSATSIEFDLACIYFGAPGYVEEDSSEDFRNTNPTVRTIAVDPSVPVYVVAGGEVGFVTVSFSDWPEIPDIHPFCPSEYCPVWLFINDAAVTEIVEQVIPNAQAATP